MQLNHRIQFRTMGPSAPEARRGGVLVFLLVIGAAIAAAWQFGAFDKLLEGKEEVAIEGAPVRRGDLRISEVVRGNLEATDSVTLKAELEGRSTIIFLEEEGKMLKEGDLVAELDVSSMEDDLVRQEIEVKNAEASATKAREQYDIQVIQNESDMASAELALELAELDFAKYVGKPNLPEEGQEGEPGEWDNELASAQETVLLREEDLARAKKDLDWSEKLLKGGFVQQNEYEGNKLAKQRAEIQLEQARRDLSLKIKFGNRRKLAELRADVGTRKRDISKVEKQASARLADFKAARESAEYVFQREEQQLAELELQLTKAKIYAPTAGLLVYAREQSRWGSGDIIAEGDEVRERQDIATIPRAGGMTIKASIHETKLKKIQVGQPCVVSVDAFPGKTFEGRVEFVAVMADSGSWRSNPNQRLYKADISLLEPTRDMRPGMSCNVEILVDDLSDVPYVPRQSIFLDGGETIAFVVESGEVSRRAVTVGLDNNKWVAIEEGLAEGETVALAPPADFEPAPVPEDQGQDTMPFGSAKSKFKAPTGGSKGGAPSGRAGVASQPARGGKGYGGESRGGSSSGRPKSSGGARGERGASATGAKPSKEQRKRPTADTASIDAAKSKPASAPATN